MAILDTNGSLHDSKGRFSHKPAREGALTPIGSPWSAASTGSSGPAGSAARIIAGTSDADERFDDLVSLLKQYDQVEAFSQDHDEEAAGPDGHEVLDSYKADARVRDAMLASAQMSLISSAATGESLEDATDLLTDETLAAAGDAIVARHARNAGAYARLHVVPEPDEDEIEAVYGDNPTKLASMRSMVGLDMFAHAS